MQNINNFISEKLKVNSQSKINNNDFKFRSHITNNPKKWLDVNWIIGSGEFKPMRFAILIEYADEILKNNLLDNEEDIEFVKNWLERAKKAYKKNRVDGFGWNSEIREFTWLCNGEQPTFGNAKFTYDLLQYALTKSDITKPRKQKVEKMLRDFLYNFENNKDKMNWY